MTEIILFPPVIFSLAHKDAIPFPISVRFEKRPPKNSRLRATIHSHHPSKPSIAISEKQKGGWVHHAPGESWLSPPGQRTHWQLGVLALDFAQPFELVLDLLDSDGQTLAKQSLKGQSAPFLLNSSIDRVERVLIVDNELTRNSIRALQPLIKKAGAFLEAVPFSEVKHDVWMQDTIEFGRSPHVTSRGIKQSVAALGGLRFPHEDVNTTPLDLRMKRFTQERSFFLIEAGAPRPKTRWIDWYGNLEVSPPTQDASGRHYPFGRVLTGKQKELTMHPGVMAFLEAQGLQVPALTLDVSWLTIGHIDEMVQFVPAPEAPGFRILIPGPARARRLLESLVLQGHGNAKLFQGRKAETTARRFLEEIAQSQEQSRIEQSLNETRVQLREGLGVTDEQILELPILFKNGLAAFPNPINGLMCNGHYFAPDPECLRIEGEDPFQKAIRETLEPLGVKTHFISVWEPYHIRNGELHCGTNAIRRLKW